MTIFQLFTLFHTLLSVVAIIAGILVVKGLVFSSGRQLWTLLFLVTAAGATLTSFFFPFRGLTPTRLLSILSVVPITLAFMGRYRYRLKGAWRGTYVIAVVTTFYINCFIWVVQLFRHVPALNAWAPTQTEAPYLIAQIITLAVCARAGVVAFKRYQPHLFRKEFSTGYVSPRTEEE